MKDFCLDFSDYLVNQKNVSDNTLDSYLRDVEHFLAYLSQQGLDDPASVDEAQMERYVENLTSLKIQCDHYTECRFHPVFLLFSHAERFCRKQPRAEYQIGKGAKETSADS